ncbi:phosphohistidine phosphatase SixA [Oceanisphaera pacifica]|uniref:Phosphohistidine phosphatase SixA n=1 Tax=Oceanisphaera pacifica TaxID=2818389 RepID=A0ABS3NFM0_9GAMM|nr:phosphohistidine phosphatase SixA [Oceanisphaera pacifica]MBO1519383.1 phosphohistidine phosphatase SixA [Oceanisphaera pacifica]
MNIFIMRHGQAAPKVSTDALRPLTDQGKSEVCLMAQWLAAQVSKFDYVLVSPYLRASQTWQQVSQYISATVVENCPELTPDADADIAASVLLAYGDLAPECHVLVISHMPMVGLLVESLCPAIMAPIFVTSGVAKVSFGQGGAGVFDWLEGPHNIQNHYPPRVPELKTLR